MSGDTKLVRSVAALATLFAGQQPIRVKHTVRNSETGEIIRQGFYEPGGNGWRACPSAGAVN